MLKGIADWSGCKITVFIQLEHKEDVLQPLILVQTRFVAWGTLSEFQVVLFQQFAFLIERWEKGCFVFVTLPDQ